MVAGLAPLGGAAQAAPKEPVKQAGAGPGQVDHGRSVAIDLRVINPAGRLQVDVRALVAVEPVALRVVVSRGDAVISTRSTDLGALRQEQTIHREVELGTLPAEDIGLSVSVVRDGDSIGNAFRAVRVVNGSAVTADSLAQLKTAAIDADFRAGRISERQFKEKSRSANLAAGSSEGKLVETSAAASTVSGRVTYRDSDNTVRPVRGGTVNLGQTNGSLSGQGRTDDNGYYTVTSSSLMAGSYYVQAVTSNYSSRVANRGGVEYNAYSTTFTMNPGDTRTGVAIDLDQASEVGRAFALLDAGRTVGDYYRRIRDPQWSFQLIPIIYPSGDHRSYFDGSWIYIRGGDTRCGTQWCPEDAFDWDVLAHESGHLVARAAGIDASPGGQHEVCENAWFGSRSKQDAVALAWSEGWATFYGQVALNEQGVPPGMPNAGGTDYNDNAGPPYRAGGSFGYSMEDEGACGPSGDDSEMAVQHALWDFWDANPDNGEHAQWSMQDILGRLKSAQAKNFSQGYHAIVNGRSAAEKRQAQIALQEYGMAPGPLSPAGGSFSAPPTFSWQAGGNPAHPNDGFTISFFNSGNGQPIVSRSVGNSLSYTPSGDVWQLLAGAGNVLAEVSASQSTAPVSGSYTGRAIVFSIGRPSSIMVVGDSISHGIEGDYTWRYRLDKHLQSNGVYPDFVGPWSGTTYTPPSQPYDYPTHTTPPAFTGQYRDNVFDSDHFAKWGRMIRDAKNEVHTQVAQYQPGIVMVELGFNDLAWGVSNADTAVADMRELINQARAARPNTIFLVANVPHRTHMSAFPYINPTIDDYNGKIGAALASVSTANSPVHLVDINGPLDPAVDSYDGLHPNGVGEFKIARAFANTLSTKVGMGPQFGSVPTYVPDIVPETPTTITAQPVDAGIRVSWNHSFAATGYWLESRNVTWGQSFARLPLPIPADSWTFAAERGHTYQFRVVAMHGSATSGTSPIAEAVANPKTSDAPEGISVRPGSTYIDLSWAMPTGPYSDSVYAYQVLWIDTSAADLSFNAATTSSRDFRISGLVPGHKYGIGITAVNAYGYGTLRGAPAAIPGVGTPSATVLRSVVSVDNNTADLSWDSVSAAAGYWINYRMSGSNDPFSRLPFPSEDNSERVSYLMPSAFDFEFCVVAANGTLEAAPSNCMSTWFSMAAGTDAPREDGSLPAAVATPGTPRQPPAKRDHTGLPSALGSTAYCLAPDSTYQSCDMSAGIPRRRLRK